MHATSFLGRLGASLCKNSTADLNTASPRAHRLLGFTLILSAASSTSASPAAPFEPQGSATRRRDRHNHYPDLNDPVGGRVTRGSRGSEAVPGNMNWGRQDNGVESRWSSGAFPRDGTTATSARHGDDRGWHGVPAQERAWPMTRNFTARSGARRSSSREKQT